MIPLLVTCVAKRYFNCDKWQSDIIANLGVLNQKRDRLKAAGDIIAQGYDSTSTGDAADPFVISRSILWAFSLPQEKAPKECGVCTGDPITTYAGDIETTLLHKFCSTVIF